MKAPDKIYIRPQAFETPWPPYIDENANYGGEQYIRKGALLEWARELNETYHKEYEISKYTCGEHWGQMVAFQKVIDKLNQM